MKRAQHFLKAIFCSSLVVLAGGAFAADVTIATEIDQLNSGDLVTSGTRLRILVKISDNTTTYSPSGIAVKVTYPTDSVSWGFDTGTPPVLKAEKAEDPDGIGPLDAWDVVPSVTVVNVGLLETRRISTVGQAIGTTPDAFYMNFTVGGTANVVPYDIDVAADDQSSNPVPVIIAPGDPGGPAVLALSQDYDNSATTATSLSDWMLLD